MNYKIIQDEKAFRDFINWLPPLRNNEIYYLTLLGRSKYLRGTEYEGKITGDKCQLKRFTSNKERMFQKVRQLECELGSYQIGNFEIPQDALVLYITVNPRDMKKATKNSCKKLLELALSDNINYNPQQEVLSEIQKANGNVHYIDFDFDEITSAELYKSIFYADIINDDALTFVQTKGGVHVLANVDKIEERYKKKYYKGMKDLGADQMGSDILLPVVGCTQGNFTPKFITFTK